MRLLFFVQRYGRDIAGGAEAACRDVATRLAARGHDVHVVTSCARSYMTWANELDPGSTEIDGVAVHRLPTRHRRDADAFSSVNDRMNRVGNRSPGALQRTWQWLQGPDLPDLVPYVERHAPAFDAAVFFTYIYSTTNAALPAAAPLVRTALVPCAHEEPPLRFRVHRPLFELPDRLLFLSPEEATLVHGTFATTAPAYTVGLGTDVGRPAPGPRDIEAFRRAHGLDGDYVAYVGRIDPNKGVDWLANLHVHWARTQPAPVMPLVLVGDPVIPLPPSENVRSTGFVSDVEREAALAGAVGLVHPSPYESFALTLIESWALGRPALVHRRSPVLAGQVTRSGGGLVFEDLSSYAAAVELLRDRPDLADALGARGLAFVDRYHRWDAVLDRWEQALAP